MKNIVSIMRNSLGRTSVLIAMGIIYAISQMIIFLIIRDIGGDRVLTLQTTFSRDLFISMIREWAASGLLDSYRFHFYVDFFHPLWYSFFLASALSRGFNANALSDRYNILLCIPFAAGFMDLVENIIHITHLSDVESISQTLVCIGAGAALAKWSLAGLSLLLASILFIKGIRRRKPAA